MSASGNRPRPRSVSSTIVARSCLAARRTCALPALVAGASSLLATGALIARAPDLSLAQTPKVPRFTLAAQPKVGVHPLRIVAGNLNGDRRPDLATADWVSSTVSVLLGTADARFERRVSYRVAHHPADVVMRNVDGDGDRDSRAGRRPPRGSARPTNGPSRATAPARCEPEERLRALEDARVTALRPGLFFESFIPALEAARELGVLADSVSPDIALPMVATRDIADVAVAELLRPEPEPFAIREVLGPRDLTHPDVAAAFDLPYSTLPYDEMAAALVGAGLSDDVARHHVDMTRAFNDGRVHPTLGRDGRSTTPTTIEEFAATLATAPVV